MAFLTLFECVLSVSLMYKSKRVHVPKYTHFSDYWLRTSAVIRVYKARSRRNGYRMFISVYILCIFKGFILVALVAILFNGAEQVVQFNTGHIGKYLCVIILPRYDNGMGTECYPCPYARTSVRTSVRHTNDVRSLT